MTKTIRIRATEGDLAAGLRLRDEDGNVATVEYVGTNVVVINGNGFSHAFVLARFPFVAENPVVEHGPELTEGDRIKAKWAAHADRNRAKYAQRFR